MKTSLSWIKQYVPDLDVTAQEYVDAMTLSGTKTEGYESLAEVLKDIVIGQIKEITPHPDADKLIVCQLDIGKDELLQIVTGAPNVKVGDKVPVVLHKGVVATDHDGHLVEGGVKIEKGKLRGVPSYGMMCSIIELGSSKDFYPEACADGIYVFDDDAVVGSDAVKALGLDDITFEYEITSNRVDCYSEIGIAREAAATFNKKFVYPEIKETGNNEDVNDYISVEVKNPKLCNRYVSRVVKNVKIEPSPKWMQRRLASVGIRPINNIVDITNYVMEEFGQPMHAYDLSTIEDNKIIVRTAENGEHFTTLDGQDHVLDESILMICDGKKPIGVAGIMGGENSMITENAKTVLFEGACFDGTNIRLSAKKLGMRTDASGKFEKGLDPNQALLAVNRACQLIEELGAGEVVGGYTDAYFDVWKEHEVILEPEKINKLLGTSISKEEMIGYLEKIDLKVNRDTMMITVPTWRQDIHCMNDVAEEVARFYGYDKIPTTLPKGDLTAGGKPIELQLYDRAIEAAHFTGYSQAMGFSFESPKVFDKLLLPMDHEARNAIKIMNPLGEDFSIMRTLSLNNILTSLSLNYNRRNKSTALFELASVYIPKSLPLTELPDEKMRMTLGSFGRDDFFSMKGAVLEILKECGVNRKLKTVATSEYPYLHPGRTADLFVEGKVIATIGEVHPLVLANYDIKERAYIAVINMEVVLEYSSFDVKFEGIAKFPAVSRDLSLLCDKCVEAGAIEETITKNAGEYLENISLFDVYVGEQIEEGKKSLAYSITFRAKDKTLDDTTVNAAMDKILSGLSNINVELRQ